MTGLDTWLQANDRHLEAALAWLRLRLERLAERLPEPEDPLTVPAPAEPPPVRGRSSWRRDRTPVPLPGDDTGAPRPATRDLDARIEAARQEVLEAEEAASPPPALVQLARAFDLGDFARDLLLLAAAPELDPGVGRILTTLQGQPWPTFALAAELFDRPDWETRSPGGALRHWHLVQAEAEGGHGLSTSPLHVDERILNALKGLDHLDARLAGLLVPVPPPTGPLPASQRQTVERALQAAARGTGETALTAVQLVGASATSRRSIARHVAEACGTDLFRLQPRLLPGGADELERLARLWHREVVLHPRVLLLDEEDGDPVTPEATAFLARTGGLVLVAAAEVTRDAPGTAAVVDVAHPTADEQLDLWRRALAPEGAAAASEVDASWSAGLDEVVEQFDLDADSIGAIVARARAADATVTTDDLWTAARQHLRPRLESAAQRVRPVATWDDLVLPEQQLRQLEQISSQVRHRHRVHRDWGFAERMNRGLGVSALFAGESGTGKSMTAEVLANDLDLDLYRIDLSAVVSKYIGETEKNLRHLFDAAEGGGVILFFDEADALFGKRSEVKDAHDRYANIETNYLLQRMEQYGGLAILATNMRSALDRAFTRRLRFVVEFAFPSRDDRVGLWRRAFPDDVPVEELDLGRLSRIDLNGAGIASAALAAAFSAAAEDRPVRLPDVLAASREELRKLQRPVVESLFRTEVAS